MATQESNIVLVKLLTKFGANVNLKTTEGITPFHLACQKGNLEMVKYLVEEFKVNLNDKDTNGATGLHFAAEVGATELVGYLLMGHAKILVDKLGKSPLHYCAINGHSEVRVKIFLNKKKL